MTSTLFPSWRRTRTGTADSCTRAMISTSHGAAFRGAKELSYKEQSSRGPGGDQEPEFVKSGGLKIRTQGLFFIQYAFPFNLNSLDTGKTITAKGVGGFMFVILEGSRVTPGFWRVALKRVVLQRTRPLMTSRLRTYQYVRCAMQ